MSPTSSFWRSLFRLIHIYAGIFIAPFIFVAAFTGLLYAITPQLEQFIYKDVLNVQPLNNEIYPLSQQIESARKVMPATAKLQKSDHHQALCKLRGLFFRSYTPSK